MFWTPEPPELSVALRATDTLVLFHPAAFADGVGIATVVGGRPSTTGASYAPISATATPFPSPSSGRDTPSKSVCGAWLELPESIAADPLRRWKSPLLELVNNGSAEMFPFKPV